MTPAPHDALFRRLFADRTIAAAALASSLPADVAARIDFSTLELQAGSHVDEALHAFHSDIVFSARISGREARLLLLLEHQSSSDAWMPFRLLRYAVLLWDGFLRDHPDARRLPLIVPVVWHHGPAVWRAPRDMLEVLDLTDDERDVLGRYAPRMVFEVEELGRLTDEQLRTRNLPAEATLALTALRDVRDATDVPALLGGWVRLAHEALQTEQGTRALRTVLRYVLEVHGGIDVHQLASFADEILRGTGASIMATAQELIDRGKAEGIAEGKKEGIAEGKKEGIAEGKREGVLEGHRAAVRRLLRFKFQAAVTEDVLARVDAADAATLERWEERILAAASIDDVLGG